MFSEQQRREIPDYALDKHTSRGRRMGRGTEHFFAEGTRLEPFAPVEDEDSWRERARQAMEAGGPLPDEQAPDQGAPFE